jgi:hypothetical protein
MKKHKVVSVLGLAVGLFLGAPSYAQKDHGASAAAGHGPNGMGSTHGNSSNAGNGGSGDAGKKAPDQLLSQNTKLSSKLQSLLPNGVTPQQACNGFKNLGQCVAAIHVSNNLGLDFNALKCDMTGKADTPTAACPTTTSSKKLSLGQSIESLKPGAAGKVESQKAAHQADEDLKDSNS